MPRKELFGREYFEEGQWKPHDSYEYWWPRIGLVLQYRRGGAVLDIGCAYGIFLKHLPDSFEKYGMDISRFAIQRAKSYLRNVVVADVEEGIPFRREFDVITCFDVLEHLREPKRAMASIRRSLRKQGIAIIDTMLDTLFYRLTKPVFDRDPSHISIPTPEDIGLWFKNFVILKKICFLGVGPLEKFCLHVAPHVLARRVRLVVTKV